MTSQPTSGYQSLLDEQRELIDAIDDELVKLINKRAKVALDMGRIKMEYGLPIYAGSREKQVLDKIADANSDGIVPQDDMRSIFEAIISASKAVQRSQRESS